MNDNIKRCFDVITTEGKDKSDPIKQCMQGESDKSKKKMKD